MTLDGEKLGAGRDSMRVEWADMVGEAGALRAYAYLKEEASPFSFDSLDDIEPVSEGGRYGETYCARFKLGEGGLEGWVLSESAGELVGW